MSQMSKQTKSNFAVSFVGTYQPRQCGIATFTHDLTNAIDNLPGKPISVSVCALNDQPAGYDYPERVKFEIKQDFLGDYSRAADYLNFGQVEVVSLQHEYGIFGGEAGSNVLTLLRDLRRPIVVTCHTVEKEPKVEYLKVFQEIAAHARKLVVMSQKAFSLLEEVYGVDQSKIVFIPHGIHDVPFIDPSYYKDKFGIEGRKVLLSFGLLARNKGIENVIEALPKIVEKHPKVIYVLLGATHPAILRLEGESYRLELQRRVRELNLEEHVLFLPKFVETPELLEYIGSSDIMVTPYHNLHQITSGVLSYAMGSGKAVVSTPYWHAEELLSDGRGVLVPPDDTAALASGINRLLDDEVGLATMRKRAYQHCRHMTWSSVAGSYLEIFREACSHGSTTVSLAAARTKPLAVTDLPVPKLDHLLRLSDDTGIAHHTRRKLPNWNYGYWMSDAAFALVATAKYCDVLDTQVATQLCERYMGFIQNLVGAGEEVVGRLDYTRRPREVATEVDIGKAIWATGYAVSHGPSLVRECANDVFSILVPNFNIRDFRGSAYAVLGAANYLVRFDGAYIIRKYLKEHAYRLTERFIEESWTEEWDGPDVGVAAQALAVAAKVLESAEIGATANNIGKWLLNQTDGGRIFDRHGAAAAEEELPLFAMSFIEALGALYHLTRDLALFNPLRTAAQWFMGKNRRGEALYDFNSGGCHDALTGGGLNRNQGTESTLACLISFLSLHELIGIGNSKEYTTN